MDEVFNLLSVAGYKPTRHGAEIHLMKGRAIVVRVHGDGFSVGALDGGRVEDVCETSEDVLRAVRAF
jgi:hypothetical protein